MRTPLNWISLYTDLTPVLAKNSIKDLAHEYSIHTAEIDGIEDHRIDKVVVGKVLSCEKHPDSTKLSIVRVWLGEHGEETILTGAPNIVDATYVPVAMVGAQLAPDFTIGERKMAGMISRGMICGADEIGLATESDGGIMILESMWDVWLLESMVGKPLWDLTFPFPGRDGKSAQVKLGDTTFEIDNKFITNRPDLFGVYGNAREWGAVFGLDFVPYTPAVLAEPGTNELTISVETPRCLAYNAVRMEGISVGRSPFGMSLMMNRAGLAPKMDLVDITNCLLTEFGQPMHVFDADKVSGNITVRLAKSGEKLLALNGEIYELTAEDMVIADTNWPIALAGIIGGMDSAVSESTVNVIWESATFDAVSVRLSAQRHGIRTDASTRYEKSLDPLLASSALPRVLDYLKFLDKNINITWVTNYLDTKQVKNITIEVSYEFINTKAGIEIPTERVHEILEKLGFTFTTNDSKLSVVVPSWRASKDISIKEDVAEEVIRIYGYDNIPLASLASEFSISAKNTEKSERNKSLEYYRGKNWNEVYNYSFTNESLDKWIGYTHMDDAVGIKNAFNESYTHMRRSLAVRLFENIRENTKHDSLLRFFEVGKVYHKWAYSPMSVNQVFLDKVEKKPFAEKKMLAWVTTGTSVESLRQDLEWYLMMMLGYVPPLHQDTGATLTCLHPGVSAVYRVGDDVVLRFWRVHPQTAEIYDIPTDTLYWECEYELILSLASEKENPFHPISRFQRIDRELNFVMSETTRTGDIAILLSSVHPWIQGVTVDSIYRDETKVWIGKKSVNYAFSLQSDESTISDEEAMNIQNMIIDRMKGEWVELRAA